MFKPLVDYKKYRFYFQSNNQSIGCIPWSVAFGRRFVRVRTLSTRPRFNRDHGITGTAVQQGTRYIPVGPRIRSLNPVGGWPISGAAVAVVTRHTLGGPYRPPNVRLQNFFGFCRPKQVARTGKLHYRKRLYRFGLLRTHLCSIFRHDTSLPDSHVRMIPF